MPKKSYGQGRMRRHQGQSNQPDKIDMDILAWVDYCREECLSGSLFLVSVVEHMRVDCGIEISQSQINIRIKSLLTRFSQAGYDLIRQGSPCLIRLDSKYKEELADRVFSIRLNIREKLKESGHRRLRSTRGDSLAPAQLISLGPKDARAVHTKKRPNTANPESNTQQKRQRIALSVKSNNRAAQRRTYAKSSTYRSLTSTKSDCFTSASVEIECSQAEELDQFSPDNEANKKPLIDTSWSATKSDHVPDSKFGEREGLNYELQAIQDSDAPGATIDVQQLISGLMQKPGPQTIKRQLHRISCSYKSEVAYFESQLSQEKKKHEHYKSLFTSRESVLAAAMAVCDTDSARELIGLQDALQNNDILEHRLANMRKFWRTSHSNSSANGDSSYNAISTRYEKLSTSIKYGLADIQQSSWQLLPIANFGIPLSHILSRMLGTQSPESFKNFVTKSSRAASDAAAVAHSLLFTVICEWVFAQPLHELMISRDDSLQIYRTYIAQNGGGTTLKNLDVAAHRSLIQSAYFREHVTKQKATLLAQGFLRLLSELSPICAQTGDEVSESSTKPPSEQYQYLRKTFEDAVRLKADMILSDFVFEVVFYSPGTTYDREHMTCNDFGHSGEHVESSAKHHVKVCLRPELLCYDQSDPLIDYTSFVRRSPGARRDCRVVQKAKVLLEEIVEPYLP